MDRGAKPAKPKVEAKRPVARRSRGPASAGARELEQRLADALEQKAAMSEVLTAISHSTFNLQPVFDMVAARAVRLCAAKRAFVYRLDGDILRPAAAYGASSELEEFTKRNPIAPGRHSAAARAALERKIVHIADVRADPEYTFGGARVDPIRTVLAVPILRLAQLLGVIVIYRLEVDPFTDAQIALVQAFADQAAVAIENARLINELEARNHSLSEALEQQAATGQVLRVISQAQTDVRPVFDVIAAAALNLCGASSALVTTFDGELINLAAIANVNPEGTDAIRRTYPTPPDRTSANSRAILAGNVVVIPDVLADAEYAVRHAALAGGFRSVLAVPLIRERSVIGAISVGRPDPGPFPDKQITLLQTFADQAVIAIENVRLFTELEARNRDLAKSLEQQTATSDVLRVIADSPTDVQPVLDTVAERAAHLCNAPFARVLFVDGDVLRTRADHSVAGETPIPVIPVALKRTSITGRAVLDSAIVHHADIVPLLDTEFPDARENAERTGFRAVLAVPLMREAGAYGAIFLWRREPGLLRARAGRARGDVCPAGGDRDRQRAPVQRWSERTRGTGAADRDQRGSARDRQLADRCPAGPRDGGPGRGPLLRRARCRAASHRRRSCSVAPPRSAPSARCSKGERDASMPSKCH